MLRKICAVALAAAGLTASPPVASASDAEFDCVLVGADAPTWHGPLYVGVVAGYVVSGSGPATLTCVVKVNGMTVTQVGPTDDVVVDVVSFPTNPGDDVDVCAVVTQHGGTTQSCFQTAQLGVDDVEAAACDVVEGVLPGDGPVYVDEHGDIYVAGEPFWDCPPYEIDGGTAAKSTPGPAAVGSVSS